MFTYQIIALMIALIFIWLILTDITPNRVRKQSVEWVYLVVAIVFFGIWWLLF